MVVVDEMGHLLGVISQSDLVEYELATEHELTVEAPFYRRPYDDALDPSRGFQIEEVPADTVSELSEQEIQALAAYLSSLR